MMLSPELQFSQQWRLAAEGGTIDSERLMDLVVGAYRDYQTEIRLAEEAMGKMRSVHQATTADLDFRLAAAKARNALLQNVLDNAPVGISLFDRNGTLVACNKQFCQHLGLPSASVQPGVNFETLRPLVKGTESMRSALLPQASETTQPQRTEFREWEMDDGRIIHVVLTFLPDGQCVAIHQDATKERKAGDRLREIALRDPLTNLANRLAFRQQLEERLAGLKDGEKLALLQLNLDFFKTINDTMGASTGDEVLKLAAERLVECLGPQDVVARLGSDEFVIIQTKARQPEGSTDLAHAIIDQLGHPFSVDGKQILLSTSIGIVIAPDYGQQLDILLRSAGMALARAKSEGRKTLRYFKPEMDARQQARRELEADLRKAVQNGEFELYYQPIYDLHREKVSTLEALLRWNHPQRGRVSPADFIPLAEEMGLIVDLGRWVLYQACLDAAQWPEEVKVSVNVSAIQFKSADLFGDIVSALAVAGLPPERLDLEITESVIIQNRDQTLALLHDLKFHGVSISMDDFGTGYSSLSYLRSFPFDKIKIDKSFVDDIAENQQALALIRAIIFLGKTLGMAITVEGVETSEQFSLLQKEACDEIQGYYVNAPRPVSEAQAMMEFYPAE
ncbi:putative bifunctional diguanylate cyclase/phosphodiesterase [Metarhizobium album]|nr:EAL domain-containing protein [Rhizobium album]